MVEPPPAIIPWWGTGRGRAALIVLLVFALAYTLQVTRELVLPIVVALVIAIVLSPIAAWLRKLRLPHALAAGIVVILFAGSVAAGLYALADPAASWMERAPQTLRDVQRKLRKVRLPMLQAQQAARQVEELTNVDGQKATPEVVVKEASLARRLLTSTQKGLIYLAETIVLVFFILAFGDAFVRKLVKIPARLRDKIHVVKILQEIKEEISHYLFTVACINAGLGAATAVAMWLLGMPNAILWGVMAATFNFVPYLGSAVTLTVLTVVALITFDNFRACGAGARGVSHARDDRGPDRQSDHRGQAHVAEPAGDRHRTDDRRLGVGRGRRAARRTAAGDDQDLFLAQRAARAVCRSAG